MMCLKDRCKNIFNRMNVTPESDVKQTVREKT